MSDKSVAFTTAGRDVFQYTSICAGGSMGLLIPAHPWSSTPLGPIGLWPPALIALVNLALNSPVPSAIYWGPGLIMIYNDAYGRNIGNRHPEALGCSAREVWKDLWPRFGHRCEAVLMEGQAYTEESVALVLEEDGRSLETFWNFTLTPIYEHGSVAGVFKTGQNVTEEVNTMHALIESDERLRMALSAGDCLGIWDWDLTTDSVVVEGKCPDLQREVQGVPFSSLMLKIHPDDHDGIYAAVEESIRTGDDYQREYRILQPEGPTRRAMVKARCIYGDEGQPLRLIGVTFDLGAQEPDRGSTGPPEPVFADASLPRASVPSQSTQACVPPLPSGDQDRGDQDRGDRNDSAENTTQPSRLALTIPKMVLSLVKKLVSDKDVVDLRTSGDCESTTLLLFVSPRDFHRIFLGESITFKAIQTLLDAASTKLTHRFTLEVADSHGNVLPPAIEMIH